MSNETTEPAPQRPETGPMQFGDDWAGTFIRGDNAGYYAMLLRALLDGELGEDHATERLALRGLLSDLASSDDRAGRDRPGVQRLAPYALCASGAFAALMGQLATQLDAARGAADALGRAAAGVPGADAAELGRVAREARAACDALTAALAVG